MVAEGWGASEGELELSKTTTNNVGVVHLLAYPPRPLIKGLKKRLYDIYTVKKVIDFPVPSREVTNQNFFYSVLFGKLFPVAVHIFKSQIPIIKKNMEKHMTRDGALYKNVIFSRYIILYINKTVIRQASSSLLFCFNCLPYC